MSILEALREIKWSILGDGYGEKPSIWVVLLSIFDLIVFGVIFGVPFVLGGRKNK